MKLIKLNFAVVAFLLGSVIAVTQSAFTPVKVKTSHKFATRYWFQGTMASQIKTASFYSVIPTGTEDPACNDADVLPCILPVEGSLSTYLSTHSNSQIVLASDQTKN